MKRNGIKLQMPDEIHYCCNDEIRSRPLDVEENIAVSALLFVPRIEKFKEIGVAEGHYVTTSQQDLFRWVGKQLNIVKKKNVTGCSHIKVDISKVRINDQILFQIN